MTEDDWLTSRDPEAMLGFLQSDGKASDRKRRLFAVACCRRIWHLLVHEISRQAIEVGERFADGLATDDELYQAYRAAKEAWGDAITAAETGLADPYAASDAANAAATVVGALRDPALDASLLAARAGDWGWADERPAQADLLRDVFGPLPLSTPRIAPRWRTPLVLSLAQAAYDERVATDPSRPGWLTLDPVRLQVLADALEEVGADPGLTDHLRGASPHVRGCHGLDAILSKE